MADSPTGPWKTRGYIMSPTNRDRGNHPGIAHFKGHNYIFGQDYDIMHISTMQHHEQRSVSMTEFEYNPDGTIKEVPYWLDQEPNKQLHWLNPYRRVEAETMAWGYGLKSAKVGIPNTGVVKDMPYSTGKKNMYITDIDNDEYIRVRGVDFGSTGCKQFIAALASESGSGTIEVRIDSANGQLLGSISTKATGGNEKFRTVTTKLTSTTTGVHDLYLCFTNISGTVNFDWWQFK